MIRAFGVVAIATLFTLFIQRFLLEVVGYAVIRRPAIDDAYVDAAFYVAMALAIALALVMVAVALPLGRLLGEPQLPAVLLGLAAMPLLDGLACVQNCLLRRNMQYKVLAFRTIGANFLGGLIGIGMAVADYGVFSLVAQQLIASAGSFVALWWASPWRPSARLSATDVREIVRVGYPMMGSALLFFVTNRLDIIVLSATLGAAATGIYSLAKRIVRLFIDLFVSGLNSVGSRLSPRARGIGAIWG